MSAPALLALVVVAGLGAAGFTAVVRTGIQDHGRVEWLLLKPFSCDLCMSLWGSIMSVAGFAMTESVSLGSAMLAVSGSVGVSLVAIKAAVRLSA